MFNTFINRLFCVCGDYRDVLVAGVWVVIGSLLVYEAHANPDRYLTDVLSGAGLLMVGLGVGALVDISIFQDWEHPASKFEPLEQYRRTFMMSGGVVGMAILLCMWGRL